MVTRRFDSAGISVAEDLAGLRRRVVFRQSRLLIGAAHNGWGPLRNQVETAIETGGCYVGIVVGRVFGAGRCSGISRCAIGNGPERRCQRCQLRVVVARCDRLSKQSPQGGQPDSDGNR